MTATLLVIHILLAVALVGVILMQRTSSDGGGMMGGSSSMGGLMTVRGTANLLTRTTSILAGGFIITSILLTILGGTATRARSIADDVKTPVAPSSEMPSTSAPTDKDAPQPTPAVPLSE